MEEVSVLRHECEQEYCDRNKAKQSSDLAECFVFSAQIDTGQCEHDADTSEYDFDEAKQGAGKIHACKVDYRSTGKADDA